jgi:hypothetical protein
MCRGRWFGVTQVVYVPLKTTPRRGRYVTQVHGTFSPPKLARQTIVRFLEAWVESPLDTGAIFVVPRMVASFWHGLSRHVMEWAELRVENLRFSPTTHPSGRFVYPSSRTRSPQSFLKSDPHIPPSLRRRTQREADDMRGGGGCRRPLSQSGPALRCSFSHRGFRFDGGIQCEPCFAAYHPDCLWVGSLFSCRRKDRQGSVFPR